HAVVPELAAFADARLVADDDALTERGAGEDDRAGRDDRAGAELERRQLFLLRGRAGRERRLLTDDGVVENLTAVPDHRPRIDDGCFGRVVAQAGVCSSEACSCSSAR